MIAINEAFFSRVETAAKFGRNSAFFKHVHVFNSSVVGAVGIWCGLSFDSLYVLSDPHFFLICLNQTIVWVVRNRCSQGSLLSSTDRDVSFVYSILRWPKHASRTLMHGRDCLLRLGYQHRAHSHILYFSECFAIWEIRVIFYSVNQRNFKVNWRPLAISQRLY